MALKILKRILRQNEKSTSNTGGSISSLIRGTSASLAQHANVTAPTVVGPIFHVLNIELKSFPVSRARYGKKQRRKPSEIEMIAFAKPHAAAVSENTSDFSYELMSKLLVPDGFPESEPRSQSPYSRNV